MQTSSFYRTSPLLVTDQPWFVNGVMEAETDLRPEHLLEVIQQIEQDSQRAADSLGPAHPGPRPAGIRQPCGEPSYPDGPSPPTSLAAFCLEPLLELVPDWCIQP